MHVHVCVSGLSRCQVYEKHVALREELRTHVTFTVYQNSK